MAYNYAERKEFLEIDLIKYENILGVFDIGLEESRKSSVIFELTKFNDFKISSLIMLQFVADGEDPDWRTVVSKSTYTYSDINSDDDTYIYDGNVYIPMEIHDDDNYQFRVKEDGTVLVDIDEVLTIDSFIDSFYVIDSESELSDDDASAIASGAELIFDEMRWFSTEINEVFNDIKTNNIVVLSFKWIKQYIDAKISAITSEIDKIDNMADYQPHELTQFEKIDKFLKDRGYDYAYDRSFSEYPGLFETVTLGYSYAVLVDDTQRARDELRTKHGILDTETLRLTWDNYDLHSGLNFDDMLSKMDYRYTIEDILTGETYEDSEGEIQQSTTTAAIYEFKLEEFKKLTTTELHLATNMIFNLQAEYDEGHCWFDGVAIMVVQMALIVFSAGQLAALAAAAEATLTAITLATLALIFTISLTMGLGGTNERRLMIAYLAIYNGYDIYSSQNYGALAKTGLIVGDIVNLYIQVQNWIVEDSLAKANDQAMADALIDQEEEEEELEKERHTVEFIQKLDFAEPYYMPLDEMANKMEVLCNPFDNYDEIYKIKDNYGNT